MKYRPAYRCRHRRYQQRTHLITQLRNDAVAKELAGVPRVDRDSD